MDAGVSQHMTPNRSWFVTYEPTDRRVIMENNNSCKVAGTGTISLKFHDGRIRTLTAMKHIPDLKKNLISLGSLEERGCKFRSEGGVLRISIGALTIMKAASTVILEKSSSNPIQENSVRLKPVEASPVRSENKPNPVQPETKSSHSRSGSTRSKSVQPKPVWIPKTKPGIKLVSLSSAAIVRSSLITDDEITKLWHITLGHMSERGMTILSKRNLLGGQCTENLEFCEHCVFGKHKRLSFSTAIHTTKEELEYIHSNLWGPSHEPSKGKGSRYMLTFIDDFSRKVWIFFLREKREVFDYFKIWKKLLETQTDQAVANR